MEHLLSDLNDEQKKAVKHGEGPLLIIAGAGTGKTKVLTHRIAYLIATKQAKPEEILAVTFTEKAANEMEERVDVLTPYSYSFVEINTFNSFGERVLRDWGHEMGYSADVRLLDDVEQAIFFRERLFQFPLNCFRPLSSPTRHIQDLLNTIRRLKQENIKPETFLAFAAKARDSARVPVEMDKAAKYMEMAEVYTKYSELLREEGKIDFEDQVLNVVELFRKRPSVLSGFQERFRFILVDEFQDTNSVQYGLLKLLVQKHRNITVVGDDDQSIFRFRGASLSNILNFRNDYPDAAKVVLNKNYRSAQPILDAAYQLIRHNNPERLEVQEQIDKKLVSVVESEDKVIHMLQFDSLPHEADRVAEIILEKAAGGMRFGDFAILVRRNADADPFLRSLNMKGIPFRFSGSRGLYSQDEIKILVSFIKALTDFEDSKSLFFLSLSAVYKLDPYALSNLANFARKKNIPLHQVFKKIHDGQAPVGVDGGTEKKVKRIFGDLLFFVRQAGSQNAGQVLYSFLEKSGILKTLVEEQGTPDEIQTKKVQIKNIRIFFDKVKNFSEISDDDSLFSFSRHLDLLQQVGDNPASAEADLEEDAVSVLTIHKSKGLEFPVVFLVGLIADRFPGRGRKEKIAIPDDLVRDKLPSGENSIQEERRLFYVGMTRAMRFLYLTWSRDYGLKRLKKVSPFVLEALDLPKPPLETLRSTALEGIKRYAFSEAQPARRFRAEEPGPLLLSFFRMDDYLTCPLRYKFRFVLNVPLLPHHNLVFGRTLHHVIHLYLKKKISGEKISEGMLIEVYKEIWANEGFLSREHEEMRKIEGEKSLRAFFRREEKKGRLPDFIEKEFRWSHKDIKFSGRWDRVDDVDSGGVIIDYKASGVRDQNEADKKTRDSLQMDLYALSFRKFYDREPREVRLHFLESDIVGHAAKGASEMDRALSKIEEAAEGIKQQNYKAKPDWHNCSHCDFRTICPDSYAY